MAMEEFILAACVLFLFIVVGMALAYAASNIAGTPLDNQYSQSGMAFFDNFDKIVILISFMLHLGILVFAFLFPSHPGFAIVGVIILIFAILIIGNLFTVLGDVLNTPAFSSLAATPNLILYSQIQPYMTIAFGLLFLVIGFGRQPSGAGVRA